MPMPYQQEPSIWIWNDQEQWSVVEGPFYSWDEACEFMRTMTRIEGYRYKIE